MKIILVLKAKITEHNIVCFHFEITKIELHRFPLNTIDWSFELQTKPVQVKIILSDSFL